MLLPLSCTGTSDDADTLPAGTSAAPDIPDPDTSSAEPRVRTTVAAARTRARNEPDSSEAWGVLGHVFHAHEMFDGAVVAYRRAVELEPDRFEWGYMLGRTLELRGGDQEVLELYERALTQRPNSAVVHLRLGEALTRSGRPEDAVSAFRRAHELAPDEPLPLRRLGEVLLQLRRADEAREVLERCRVLAPLNRGTASALVQALTQLGEDDRADELELTLGNLQDETLDMPDETFAHVMAHGVSSAILYPRGVALANQRRYEDAMRLFRICEEIHPESPRLNAWMGSTLLALGQTEAAREHLERSLRNFAQEYRALITLAQIEIRDDNLERARRLLERAIEAVPENAPAYAILALVEGREQRFAEAVRHFMNAEQRGSLTARDLFNLAEAHIALREMPEAGRRLQQSIQLNPDYVAPRMRLAELLEVLGRRTEARAQYAEVLRIDAGNTRALERFRAIPPD